MDLVTDLPRFCPRDRVVIKHPEMPLYSEAYVLCVCSDPDDLSDDHLRYLVSYGLDPAKPEAEGRYRGGRVRSRWFRAKHLSDPSDGEYRAKRLESIVSRGELPVSVGTEVRATNKSLPCDNGIYVVVDLRLFGWISLVPGMSSALDLHWGDIATSIASRATWARILSLEGPSDGSGYTIRVDNIAAVVSSALAAKSRKDVIRVDCYQSAWRACRASSSATSLFEFV